MKAEKKGEKEQGPSLGLRDGAVRAKTATNDQDVRRTWILFGDPTTKLKY